MRQFAAADPSRAARRAIDFGRLTAKPHKRIILCFSHTLGGGIERYLLARSAAGRGKEVLIVARPEWNGNSISLEILGDVLDCPNLRGISCLEEDGELSELLASSRIDHVEVHSLFGYNSALVRLLPVLCRKLKLDYDFYLHDYLPLCPRINLVDSTNRYCGEAGQRQCCTCLRRKNPRLPPAHVDLLDSGPLAIRAWRSMYGDLLTRARAVVCPSKDARRRILRYLPGLRTILAPHEERDDATLVPVRQRKDRGRTLRIGVIGGLSVAKGAFVIADCARVALTSQDPVEFVVIGHSTELKTHNLPNVKMTGRYKDKRLHTPEPA